MMMIMERECLIKYDGGFGVMLLLKLLCKHDLPTFPFSQYCAIATVAEVFYLMDLY